MGVINLSADSWYRESVSLSTETAIRRGRRLLADGATAIDIGAESTLSHAARVDGKNQRAALLPVISALAEAGAIVSAETYDQTVAEACLDAGAAILNLTSATNTEDFYRLVAERDGTSATSPISRCRTTTSAPWKITSGGRRTWPATWA
jgi:dihydropteroate synthase